MEYFNRYISNNLAGSSNQTLVVNGNENEIKTCRIYYKAFCPGELNYSFLFSNIIDSTFGDGKISRKNQIIDSWQITEAKVGTVEHCGEHDAAEPDKFHGITFDGKVTKEVFPGEFFSTDPVRLNVREGEYLCVQISYKGKEVPCHEESIIPSFVLENGSWTFSKKHPFPSMIGCDREVKGRIAFFGDSITQGIGTPNNSYTHWNSVFADIVGRDYSYWNLGIGCGRADDASSDGAWLYKAKQSDIVFVCFGVNDILWGYSAEEIIKNTDEITDRLSSSGVKVILQTVPPFDYSEEKKKIWEKVNSHIRERNDVLVFDCADILKKSDSEAHIAKYGGHPDEEGCRVWGESLARFFSEKVK